jgi:hypothetical protein
MHQTVRLAAAALLIFANVCFLDSQKAPAPAAVEDSELEGVALFECQCTANACPCQKNGAPTHGTCEAADFAHIRTGHYGKLRLDGLNAVVVGNLVDRNSARLYATIYTIYIDQIANPAQRAALVSILQLQNVTYETSPLKASQLRAVPMSFNESSDKTPLDFILTNSQGAKPFKNPYLRKKRGRRDGGTGRAHS